MALRGSGRQHAARQREAGERDPGEHAERDRGACSAVGSHGSGGEQQDGDPGGEQHGQRQAARGCSGRWRRAGEQDQPGHPGDCGDLLVPGQGLAEHGHGQQRGHGDVQGERGLHQ